MGTKGSALTPINGSAIVDTDKMFVLDTTDVTQGPAGTWKIISITELRNVFLPVAGGSIAGSLSVGGNVTAGGLISAVNPGTTPGNCSFVRVATNKNVYFRDATSVGGTLTTGALIQSATDGAAAWAPLSFGASQYEWDVNGSVALGLSSTGITYTGTLIGSTGVMNIGGGQIYKDAAGNVGIGVTPRPWNNGYSALQIKSFSLMANSGGAIYQMSNAFFDTGSDFRYIFSDKAAFYSMSSGVHAWANSASGTAGNVVSFTTAMTLDASSNLAVTGNIGAGIAPATRLHVYSTDYSKPSVIISGGGDTYGQIECSDQDRSSKWQLGCDNAVTGNFVVSFNAAKKLTVHQSGGLSLGNTTDPGAANLSITGTIKSGSYTVATLPSASDGLRAFVTDALAPAFGSAAVGGGAVHVPVYVASSTWIVG